MTSGSWFSFLVRQLLILAIVVLAHGSAIAADDAGLWSAIKNGEAFAIMRHALAPGTGDPEHFSVTDCTTQRNLSKEGRAQASMIGSGFRSRGITAADIYSSEWCRCKETAQLLDLGEVRSLPPLNSFYESMGRRDEQTRALKKWLMAHKGTKPLVLVSHQVNISALTGRPTGSGEAVVAQVDNSGRVVVLGTLE